MNDIRLNATVTARQLVYDLHDCQGRSGLQPVEEWVGDATFVIEVFCRVCSDLHLLTKVAEQRSLTSLQGEGAEDRASTALLRRDLTVADS